MLKQIFFYCKFRRFRLRIFFTKLQNFGDFRFLVKVFEYGYISVTINGIPFIFDIQLAKDLGSVLKVLFQVFESASNLEMCY